LRNKINICINEFINHKRDDRPIFCYFEEYMEQIETCILMKLSEIYYEERAKQTTVQLIEYQYKVIITQMMYRFFKNFDSLYDRNAIYCH
jgi:hypothetical protein